MYTLRLNLELSCTRAVAVVHECLFICIAFRNITTAMSNYTQEMSRAKIGRHRWIIFLMEQNITFALRSISQECMKLCHLLNILYFLNVLTLKMFNDWENLFLFCFKYNYKFHCSNCNQTEQLILVNKAQIRSVKNNFWTSNKSRLI